MVPSSPNRESPLFTVAVQKLDRVTAVLHHESLARPHLRGRSEGKDEGITHGLGVRRRGIVQPAGAGARHGSAATFVVQAGLAAQARVSAPRVLARVDHRGAAGVGAGL